MNKAWRSITSCVEKLALPVPSSASLHRPPVTSATHSSSHYGLGILRTRRRTWEIVFVFSVCQG